MDNKNIKDEFHNIHVLAHLLASNARGQVINLITILETNIDIYIARHFCKTEENQMELMELIVSSRMPFDAKRLVFKFLLDKYNPEFVLKNPDLHSELGKLNDIRNIFAHYPLDVTPSGLKSSNELKIPLVKFKNSRVTLDYTLEDMETIFKRILDASSTISTLLEV